MRTIDFKKLVDRLRLYDNGVYKKDEFFYDSHGNVILCITNVKEFIDLLESYDYNPTFSFYTNLLINELRGCKSSLIIKRTGRELIKEIITNRLHLEIKQGYIIFNKCGEELKIDFENFYTYFKENNDSGTNYDILSTLIRKELINYWC